MKPKNQPKRSVLTAAFAAALVSLAAPTAFAGTLLCQGYTPELLPRPNGGTTNVDMVDVGGSSSYHPGALGFITGATAQTECPVGTTYAGFAATAAELQSVVDGYLSTGSADNPNAVLYNNNGSPANPGTVTVADGVNGKDAANVDQLNAGMSNTLNNANRYTDSKVGDAYAYTDSSVQNAISVANNYTDEKTKYFQANSTGPASVVTGNDSIAIGPGTVVAGNRSIAGGLNAVASGDDTVVFGSNAKGSGNGSVALGAGSQALGNGAIALGNTAQALQNNGLALGSGASANNANDVALGAGSTTAAAVATTGATINSTQYQFAGAAPTSTVSVGSEGVERTITNVAAGRLSATSTDAVNGSQLDATNRAVNAIGANIAGNNAQGLPPATATGNNSVAIGPGSVADRDNTISFGAAGEERQLTNIAAGSAATDATNLGQVQSMVGGGVREANAYTDRQIQALDEKTQKQMAGVGALAMASSALVPNARAEGNSSISMAAGAYGGESAVAAGVNYYASNQILLNAKVGVTSAGPARVGFAIGATIGF